MVLNIVLGMVVISSFLSALAIWELIKEQRKLQSIIDGSFYDSEESEDDSNSVISQHVLQREASFDERINKMREELNIGSVAEILHPDVENLPHDSVRNVPLYEEEEYAK